MTKQFNSLYVDNTDRIAYFTYYRTAWFISVIIQISLNNLAV